VGFDAGCRVPFGGDPGVVGDSRLTAPPHRHPPQFPPANSLGEQFLPSPDARFTY